MLSAVLLLPPASWEAPEKTGNGCAISLPVGKNVLAKREIAILEENYLPGFSATAMLHNVDIRDINFDGSEDLGLPCDSTHYDPHAWYVWDGVNQQFRYAFSLEGYPTIDTEEQRIIEHRFEEGDHAYSFNARGQLVWMGPVDSLEE